MHFTLPTSRRQPHIFLAFLLGAGALLLLHLNYQPRSSFLPIPKWSFLPTDDAVYQGMEESDYRVRERVQRLRDVCEAEDGFEVEYGRTNLRMSRGYEGSHHRLRQFLHKALRGEDVTITAIGGSVTKGHQVEKDQIWFVKFGEWLESLFPEANITSVNGAAPATGSDYFSFCFPLHIPLDADLVLVELAINDEGIPEHYENMENLLRGLLGMEKQPAVVLVETLAFSTGGMAGGGGRIHLPIAQYFDVPVINQRHPLANHFARYPQLIRPYFATEQVNWWQNSDTRHINSRGHRDLGNLVASLVHDVGCTMVSETNFHVPALELTHAPIPIYPVDGEGDVRDLTDQMLWAEQSRSWEREGKPMPGMWNTPTELGVLPRLRALDGWNPNLETVVPPFHPTCMSTRSVDPRFDLTPVTNEGWEFWIHPEHADKPYILARDPSARVTFELETSVGVVKMYALKSKIFGLGMVECWADEERDRSTKVDGFWDNDMNIGRFATIRTDLRPGKHQITCEVSNETNDPGGGHEFRMISLMSV